MKAWFTAIALLFAAPALAAAQPQDISRPGVVAHAAARAGFPEQVGPFRRVHVMRFEEDNISANYDLRRGEDLIRLSIYIYPGFDVPRNERAAACRAEMASIHDAISSRYSNVRRIESGEAPALPGTETGLRLGSVHRLTMPRDGRDEEVRRESRLYCYVDGGWQVKYYVSSTPGFTAEEVSTAIDAFARDGPWPGRGPGSIAMR